MADSLPPLKTEIVNEGVNIETSAKEEADKALAIVNKAKKSGNAGDLFKWANFNILPIAILLFFFSMLIVFAIPQVNVMINKLTTIEKSSKSAKSKESMIEDLNLLKAQQVENNQLIVRMEQLVPSRSTEVVQFKDTLVQIAQNMGLNVTESRAGEIIRNDEKEDEIVVDLNSRPLTLIEIPTEISAIGTIEQFQLFLTAIYESEDFFIVQEMEISKQGNLDQWQAEFVIIKYQFDGEVTLPEDFTASIYEKPSQSVIDFLNRKFLNGNKNLEEETDDAQTE